MLCGRFVAMALENRLGGYGRWFFKGNDGHQDAEGHAGSIEVAVALQCYILLFGL
jgi:hypothetical protein